MFESAFETYQVRRQAGAFVTRRSSLTGRFSAGEDFAAVEAEEVWKLLFAGAAEKLTAVSPRRVVGFYKAMRMSEPLLYCPEPTFYSE